MTPAAAGAPPPSSNVLQAEIVADVRSLLDEELLLDADYGLHTPHPFARQWLALSPYLLGSCQTAFPAVIPATCGGGLTEIRDRFLDYEKRGAVLPFLLQAGTIRGDDVSKELQSVFLLRGGASGRRTTTSTSTMLGDHEEKDHDDVEDHAMMNAWLRIELETRTGEMLYANANGPPEQKVYYAEGGCETDREVLRVTVYEDVDRVDINWEVPCGRYQSGALTDSVWMEMEAEIRDAVLLK